MAVRYVRFFIPSPPTPIPKKNKGKNNTVTTRIKGPKIIGKKALF